MSVVYVAENGAVIGIDENRLSIKYKDGLNRLIPIETIDAITILGKNQLTTQCMECCMERGIPVTFFSKGGRYFGRLMSTSHIKASLQRKQSGLYESDFSIELARRILMAKIRNQMVVLRRYAKSRDIEVDGIIILMDNSKKKINYAKSIQEMMGHEGIAARYYFQGLSKCIEDGFAFESRSRRPPKDEFNSLISLGYSILMNDLYCEIENRGLNPYFGFLHRDAEHHPTLASDLMEEWRAVLIDSLAMSMINGHEIVKSDFILDEDNGGCYLTKECLRKYITKLDVKLNSKTKYLSYIDYDVSFRTAISLQIESLVKAIREEDYDLYKPVLIR